MELKDDTDVSLWPSQPSVTGSRPSRTGPVMWRNWWEAYVDQSLWAGSCPLNMADSQLQLMQRCEQRTDGRNILSHRNVCMKHSNDKKKMLQDLWVTPSTAELSGKDYLSRSGIHQKALLVKMWSFCKRKSWESEWVFPLHLFYSRLSAICPCCCTALIPGAPGHTQMLLPASTMPILRRLQFQFRVIVKQSHVIELHLNI